MGWEFEKFDSFYRSVYGERWTALLAALRADEVQVARWSAFVPEAASFAQGFAGVDGCFVWDGSMPSRSANGLLQFYVMDPASVLIARALDVRDGDSVLDLCAAPGGKSLVLAEALITGGELAANEMSAARKERLKKVIQQYVPREVRDRIWVSGAEGGSLASRNREKYDRVLVDAPCSGERHLLENEKAQETWNPTQTGKLAQRQYALLTAALEAVKPGGLVVYSTCSISPGENDGVISRLLKKKADRVEVVSASLPVEPERTEFGFQYLPDQFGFGPLYGSVLRKL